MIYHLYHNTGSDKFRLPESPEIGNSIEQETEEIEKNTRGSKVSKVSKGKKTKVTEAGSKSRKRKAPASNGHLELKEPIEIEDEVEKPSEFCPVKGQKTAWKRLNKLRGLSMVSSYIFSRRNFCI